MLLILTESNGEMTHLLTFLMDGRSSLCPYIGISEKEHNWRKMRAEAKETIKKFSSSTDLRFSEAQQI